MYTDGLIHNSDYFSNVHEKIEVDSSNFDTLKQQGLYKYTGDFTIDDSVVKLIYTLYDSAPVGGVYGTQLKIEDVLVLRNGVDGLNQTQIQIFKVGTQIPDSINEDLEWDFTTSSFTDESLQILKNLGWETSVPKTTLDNPHVYTTMCGISSNMYTAIIKSDDWSDIVEYSPSLKTQRISLYKRTNTKPTGINAYPSGTLIWNFYKGSFEDDTNLNGWSLNVPDDEKRSSCYTITSVAIGNGDTDEIKNTEWTEPVRSFMDGVSFLKLTNQYALGTSRDNPPSSGWGEEYPVLTLDKRYMWGREIVYNDDDTTSYTTPHFMCELLKSIDTIEETYALSTSNTTHPDTGWSTSRTSPTSESPYLWNRETISYTDGSTPTVTYCVVSNYAESAYFYTIDCPLVFFDNEDVEFSFYKVKGGTKTPQSVHYVVKGTGMTDISGDGTSYVFKHSEHRNVTKITCIIYSDTQSSTYLDTESVELISDNKYYNLDFYPDQVFYFCNSDGSSINPEISTKINLTYNGGSCSLEGCTFTIKDSNGKVYSDAYVRDEYLYFSTSNLSSDSLTFTVNCVDSEREIDVTGTVYLIKNYDNEILDFGLDSLSITVDKSDEVLPSGIIINKFVTKKTKINDKTITYNQYTDSGCLTVQEFSGDIPISEARECKYDSVGSSESYNKNKVYTVKSKACCLYLNKDNDTVMGSKFSEYSSTNSVAWVFYTRESEVQ